MIGHCKEIIKRCALVPIRAGLWRPMTTRLSILNYHRVLEASSMKSSFDPNRALSVTAEAFDSQLAFVKRVGNFLTLAEAVSIYSGRNERRKGGVVITFDDGFRDNMTVALPIAEKYEAPIAIFVTSGFIDRTADLWWEEHTFILNRLDCVHLQVEGNSHTWEISSSASKERAAVELRTLFKKMDVTKQRAAMQQLREQCHEKYSYDTEMLTWEELQSLVQHPLVTLGVHTVNHPVLSRLTPDEVHREIKESHQRLESKLGVPFEYFAYPMGQQEYASYREFAIVEECGLKAAFTAGPSVPLSTTQERLFHIPRIPVDNSDSLMSFAWKASGL